MNRMYRKTGMKKYNIYIHQPALVSYSSSAGGASVWAWKCLASTTAKKMVVLARARVRYSLP